MIIHGQTLFCGFTYLAEQCETTTLQQNQQKNRSGILYSMCTCIYTHTFKLHLYCFCIFSNTEEFLALTTGIDSLAVDSLTLISLLSENDQLKSFMEENSALLETITLQLQDTILECDQSFKNVQSKLLKT